MTVIVAKFCKLQMEFSPTERCPETYRDWSDRARAKCTKSDQYHCVDDEVSRTVEVCVQPVCIEPGIVCVCVLVNLCVLAWVTKQFHRWNVNGVDHLKIHQKLLCLIY